MLESLILRAGYSSAPGQGQEGYKENCISFGNWNQKDDFSEFLQPISGKTAFAWSPSFLENPMTNIRQARILIIATNG
jgi:hypothetical protein